MLKNELLQQSQAKVEEGVKDRAAYDRIVTAGLKVIYDKKMFGQLIKGLDEAEDPMQAVGEGIQGILGILYKQSRKTMPIVPMLQAGTALLLDALDFLEQSGMAKIGKDELATATGAYINGMLPKMGLTPQKMDEVLARVKGAAQDPAMAQQFQQQGA